MNKRRIDARLTKVFHAWKSSIESEEIQKMLIENTIITGGSIVSLLTGAEPKDYDIYFRNKETVLAVMKYYVKIFNDQHQDESNRFGYKHKAFVLDGARDLEEQLDEAGETPWWSRMLFNMDEDRVKIIVRSDGVAGNLPAPEEIIEDADDIPADVLESGYTAPKEDKKKDPPKPYRPIFLSTNAITLSDKIQLVARFYGVPDDIHDTFDFIHCFSYWTPLGGTVLDPGAMEMIMNKQLFYVGSKYPLCSVIRVRKFLKKGWNINAGQILKMCFQLSQLNLTNPDVLEDQLIGVDTVYFKELIDRLRRTQEEAEESGQRFEVGEHYISSLVDKIFG